MNVLKVSVPEACEKILQHYGPMKQMVKTVEEMAELTQAIAKFLNAEAHETVAAPLREKMREETADVLIMVLQLASHFGMDAVLNLGDAKIARTLERIDKEKAKGAPLEPQRI